MSEQNLRIRKIHKQTLISDYFKPKPKTIRGFNDLTGNYHCLECGDNMGPNNARQLCGKYYCYQNK